MPRAVSSWVGNAAWAAFLVWTLVGAGVMPLGITPQRARDWLGPGAAGELAAGFLGVADLIWMLLAAAVVHGEAVRAEGPRCAGLGALLVMVGSAAVEWTGATTGWPFGPYVYTERFGPRLGVLPVAIPLAWFVIVQGARLALARWNPAFSRGGVALGVGVAAVLPDLNLEPVAWKLRGYWTWYPGDPTPPAWPPAQNYVAWFAVAALLAATLPSVRSRGRPSLRPALVLGLMNALFLWLHLARALH